jgi:hypothetical protein
VTVASGIFQKVQSRNLRTEAVYVRDELYAFICGQQWNSFMKYVVQHSVKGGMIYLLPWHTLSHDRISCGSYVSDTVC